MPAARCSVVAGFGWRGSQVETVGVAIAMLVSALRLKVMETAHGSMVQISEDDVSLDNELQII